MKDHADGQQPLGVGFGLEQARRAPRRRGRASSASVASSVASTRLRSQRTTSSRWNACATLPPGPIVVSRQPFSPDLADMPALGIAREDHGGIAAMGLAGVDVAQRPVVVAAAAEVVDRARGVTLMALETGQARVEQADVDPARNGIGIAGGEVLGDGGLARSSGRGSPRRDRRAGPSRAGRRPGRGRSRAGGGSGSSCWRRRDCRR